MAASIGMMDGAYFVGRSEILSLIKASLQLSLSRVEEAASGAVKCQMIDIIKPGIVPMSMLNFDAKYALDMIHNYKVLQEVFNKLKIEKHIEVNKLIKVRPLDNLEFLQWLNKYCDSENGGMRNEKYNPMERRSKVGKERNLKGASQPCRSLQLNDVENRGSTDSGILSASGPNQRKVCAKSNAGCSEEQIQELCEKIADLKVSLENAEKEETSTFQNYMILR